VCCNTSAPGCRLQEYPRLANITDVVISSEGISVSFAFYDPLQQAFLVDVTV